MPDTALYTYTLKHDGTPGSWDEALAVACLQGLINRERPRLYVLSPKDTRPAYWLDKFTGKWQWLHGRNIDPVADLDALAALARRALKGVVVWDPAVPASVNVATTIAGVRDGVALHPENAEQCAAKWNVPVLDDLRGRFTGAETGSAKNDAYRWAIREYLEPGRCSNHWLCLFEDSFSTRARGDIGYVVTRDWAVRNRSFTYDLSPWGDEVPADDPNQRLGLDLETYHMLLAANLKHSAGKVMTEVAGFFAFSKYSNMPDHPSRHDPVPTEWETVWLISPYNCYQNTVASDCYNQSLHCRAPREPRRQRRPAPPAAVGNKAYVCVLMADYDSATPLYSFMPTHWDDPVRGSLPLCWGIDPNLVETYPDVIAHLYETATPNDHFAADASAAGYMNPNRVKPEHLPLFIEHNRRFYKELDMTMSPMVLDWDEPSEAVKDAFTQFSPDGFATIVMDLHGTGGKLPRPHVWKGMPVLELINDGCNFSDAGQAADTILASIRARGGKVPGFYFFRIVWTQPSLIRKTLDLARERDPRLPLEVVDPYTFFRLFRAHHQAGG